MTTLEQIFDSGDASLYDVRSTARGPLGALPLTPELLLHRPSGELFGWSHNTGMGWDPADLGRKEFLLLSTHGGIRAADGTPVALGYHTGHWEVALLVDAAAKEIKALGAIPFAGYVTDPCDGRTMGTTGMFDSLPYRNDAAAVFGRLIRSLPTRKGVMGVATCDKGLPAMMMALASARALAGILVPGGVTLRAEQGEDAGTVQSVGARYAHGQITLEAASEVLCNTCASPGGGCQFLGTAATSQVVGEALGMTLPHSALAPSGHPIWVDMARRSARALMAQEACGRAMKDILCDGSVRNAMVVHAAFGGSTNLVLHIPAIAWMAGLTRPTVDDWTRINRQIPRLVDSLPNGPKGHPTVQVFMAGGVPEVMLHLRRAGLLETKVLTASGQTLDANLDWWEQSERRAALRKVLRENDGIDPDDVIMDADGARRRGLTSTVTFPKGNLAPGGLGYQEHSHRPDRGGCRWRLPHDRPARACSSPSRPSWRPSRRRAEHVEPGDVVVLMCRGPMGSGMEEILPGHRGAPAPGFRQARSRHHRCAFQRRLDRRLHRPRDPRGAGGRAARQAPGGRSHRDRDRPREVGRIGQPGGSRWRDFRRRGRRARIGRASAATGSGPRPGSAEGYASVGGVAKRQRWNLGGLRIRRRGHHSRARESNVIVRKFQEND